MADLKGFDANQVEPSTDFDPIPAGKYLAVVTESEMKPNKAGTGHYLQLAFQIIDGPYKNRYLWARLNLDNPNATAVQIARAELSAICRAVGVLAPKDSTDLHDLPLVIHVTSTSSARSGPSYPKDHYYAQVFTQMNLQTIGFAIMLLYSLYYTPTLFASCNFVIAMSLRREQDP